MNEKATGNTEPKVLILCTGNSCRSQMAHGFLQAMNPNVMVRSAGTEATGRLNPKAVKAMKEVGIDIGNHRSEQVSRFLAEPWDHVITVCGGANENCPAFTGKVNQRHHIGFDDPTNAQGSPAFVDSEYRRVRDEIREAMEGFYKKHILNP